MIVSPVSGTTRDPVCADLDYQPQKGKPIHFRLIDTAGLRHRTKVGSPVEVFSQIKARQALEKSDIAILVVDAKEGVTKQDQLLADLIGETGKPFVIAVNKWDLALKAFQGDKIIEGYQTIKDFEVACKESLLEKLFFVSQVPFIFLSAKESINLDPLVKSAQKVEASQDQRWSTPQINRLVGEILMRNLPRNPTGKMFKVYYATQTGTRPYRVRLFCNQAEGVNDSFRRFFAREFAEHFGVEGCPVFFDFVSKPKRVWANKPSRTISPQQKRRLRRHKK
jgi:GTP-binding protein